jgi:cytochrome c oxidase assembly factor CtaG
VAALGGAEHVTVFAHAGHWLPQLLYLAPLVVLVVAILIGRARDRREAGTGPTSGDTPQRPDS